MKKTTLLILAALTVSTTAMAAELYRWTDADGRVHYTDMPPPSAAAVNTETKRTYTETPAPALSYAMRKTAADFPVTLYTSENCGVYCDNARALLQERGIPFTEKKILTEDERSAFKKLFNDNDLLPSAMVGVRQLVGFETGTWNTLLDKVGYPPAAAN